jgi:hypothetical protein
MANRGRKGAPLWYIEDFQGKEGESVGKYVTSTRSKGEAYILLKQYRRFEREGKLI